ncbi:hypothetical protein MR857_13395 [bacterium]|nr:hypothetical protein [bacterium]MDY3022402.1 hypothetical protein [Oliverpabstia sp.]
MGKIRVRNPTLAQKKIISAAGLIARNWYVLSETDTELHLISKGTGRSRKVRKEIKSHDRKRV